MELNLTLCSLSQLQELRKQIDQRIQALGVPNLLTTLFPELWTLIFSKGHAEEFKGLLLTSKWCHELFWRHQTHYKFTNSNLNNTDLTFLLSRAHRQNLKSLELIKTNVTDLSALVSSKLFGLETLIIHSESKLNLSMTSLVGFSPNLAELNLKNVELYPREPSELGRLTKLRTLRIVKGLLTLDDTEISFLSKLTNLTDLTLSINHPALLARDVGEGISLSKSGRQKLIDELGDCNFGVFFNLKNLTHLDCGPFLVGTDKNLSPITQLPLIRLVIQQGQLIGDHGLDLISQMTQLKELFLGKLQWTSNWASLSRLPNVVDLWLPGAWIDDQGLARLAEIKTLQRLDVSHSPHLSDVGITNFLTLAQEGEIEWIRLFNCERLRQYSGYSKIRAVRSKGRFIEWIKLTKDC